MNNAIDTSTLLTQLRSMAREAGVPAPGAVVPDVGASSATRGPTPAGGIDLLARMGDVPSTRRGDEVVFTDLFKRSVEGVNARSQTSRGLTEAFESGRSDVELADVMIAVQKARVSFEALTQVRNKMVSAYKEVMSMPL